MGRCMARVPAVPVVPWLSISCLPWEAAGSRGLGLRVPPDLRSCTSLAVVAPVWATCPLCQLSVSLAGTTSSRLPPPPPAICSVPRAAGGHPGRAAGWALAHVSPTLPARVLGPASAMYCRAHMHPWQLRQERLRAQLAGDVSRGSGTLFGVWGHSRPQVPPGGVLGCPHSTALPRPPGPRQHHHLSLFFF